MIIERKRFFVDELKAHYQVIISGAHRAETEAATAAEQIRGEARKKEDAKSAVEQSRMEAGHRTRRKRAAEELEALIKFAERGLRRFPADAPVALGALVDVSIETDERTDERTVFLLPVGAGTELEGPGGDGFISVITPASPVGKALRGSRSGDSFEIVIRGEDREWTVVDLC
jgi:transcription elongation GreA/GreB family factor